jgi:hypothetical protein
MTFDFAQAVNMLSAAATSVAALLIYIQIRSDRAWSRLETSHNILNDFVSGKLEDTIELLEQKLGWDILHDGRTYDEVTRDIDPANIDELDRLLRRLSDVSRRSVSAWIIVSSTKPPAANISSAYF